MSKSAPKVVVTLNGITAKVYAVDDVIETHYCSSEKCQQVTLWSGKSDFTNIAGYPFIYCSKCGIATIGSLDESFYLNN